MKNFIVLIAIYLAIFTVDMYFAAETDGTVTLIDVNEIVRVSDYRYGEPFQHIDKVYMICTYLADDNKIWSMGLCVVELTSGGVYKPRLLPSTSSGSTIASIETTADIKLYYKNTVLLRINAYLLERTNEAIDPNVITFPDDGSKDEKFIYLIERGSIYNNGQLISLH